MANVNPQLVPLNPSPITSQPKHQDCLTPLEDCLSERFVQCVNTREGTCCLTGALCCAVGGITTSGYGLSLIMNATGLATPSSIATTVVGMAMQSCGFLTAGSMFGVGCGQTEMAKTKDEEIQNLHRDHTRRFRALSYQHQRVVAQIPGGWRDNESDGYGSDNGDI